MAPLVVSVWENGDGNKTNTQSQFTAVPHLSPNMPQQLNGIQSPNQILATGLKQAGSILLETSAPSSIPKKECQIGLNVQLTGTMQKYMSVSRCQAVTGDATLGSKPFMSVQDLFIKGQPSLQQSNKLMVSIDVSTEAQFKLSIFSNIKPRFQKRWDTTR